MLVLRGLIGAVFQVALFATLLLVPAGTWQWPRAIQFLVVYFIVLSVSIVALGVLAPASLEARLGAPTAKSQPVADRVATALIILAIAAWFVFIPIDVFRLQLLPPMSLGVSVLGAIVAVFGYGVTFAVLLQNAFAAPIVKDQSDRGQQLVDTGLYGFIRHPFYLGMLLMFAGIALWLESYAGVLALIVVFGALVTRVTVEERTLRETLPGYSAYTEQVRYRIIPYVW
jgi:protein-S-isoprenylcysteine O-methyltransferase Ste14